MNQYIFIRKVFDILQRCIETAIPFCCFLAQLFLAFDIATPPTSITDVLTISTFHFWSLVSVVFYLAVIIGVWIKPSKYLIFRNGRKNDGDSYILFEYPGLIGSSILTSVYAGALIVKFGFLSTSFVAIVFTLSIALYFLLKFIRLHIILRIAKMKEDSTVIEE